MYVCNLSLDFKHCVILFPVPGDTFAAIDKECGVACPIRHICGSHFHYLFRLWSPLAATLAAEFNPTNSSEPRFPNIIPCFMHTTRCVFLFRVPDGSRYWYWHDISGGASVRHLRPGKHAKLAAVGLQHVQHCLLKNVPMCPRRFKRIMISVCVTLDLLKYSY